MSANEPHWLKVARELININVVGRKLGQRRDERVLDNAHRRRTNFVV